MYTHTYIYIYHIDIPMSFSTFHLKHVFFHLSGQPFQAEFLDKVGAQKRSSSSPVDLPARQMTVSFVSSDSFFEKHHVFFTWPTCKNNCDDINRSSFFLGSEYFTKLRHVKVMLGSSSEDFQSLIIFLPKNLGLARQRRLQQLQAEGLLELYLKKTQQPIRLSDCSEGWNVTLVCHAKKSEVHVKIRVYIYI